MIKRLTTSLGIPIRSLPQVEHLSWVERPGRRRSRTPRHAVECYVARFKSEPFHKISSIRLRPLGWPSRSAPFSALSCLYSTVDRMVVYSAGTWAIRLTSVCDIVCALSYSFVVYTPTYTPQGAASVCGADPPWSVRSSRVPRSQRPDQPERIAQREENNACLLYTSPSPRDRSLSRMPSSA